MEDLTHLVIKELFDNHGPSFTDLKNFTLKTGYNDSEAKVNHVKLALKELEQEGLITWHAHIPVRRDDSGDFHFEEQNKNGLGTQGIEGLINFHVFRVEARLTLKGLDYAIDFFNKKSMHLSALSTNRISRISNWAIGLFTLVLAITAVTEICFKINERDEANMKYNRNEILNKISRENLEHLNSSIDSVHVSLKQINKTLIETSKTKAKSNK